MTEIAGPVRYRAGVPVYRYRTAPEVPPVSVLRFDPDAPPGHGQRHIHDFPVLIYIDRAARPPACDGDAYVLTAGAVVDPTVVTTIAEGRGVFFDPTALGGDGQVPWLSWRAHPLLLPFLHGIPGGLLRLHVPPARQPVWTTTIAAIETELAGRAEGYRQATLAYLTLLLVDVARLEPLSLRDVASTIGMTPGHLTTLVRRRTGRTVVDWITERRMTQARQLLAHTDLPISEIARRVGIPDAGYFARQFRHGNGMTARAWRRNARQAVAADGGYDRITARTGETRRLP